MNLFNYIISKCYLNWEHIRQAETCLKNLYAIPFSVCIHITTSKYITAYKYGRHWFIHRCTYKTRDTVFSSRNIKYSNLREFIQVDTLTQSRPLFQSSRTVAKVRCMCICGTMSELVPPNLIRRQLWRWRSKLAAYENYQHRRRD